MLVGWRRLGKRAEIARMKLQAAILDWAGTVVDHGSRAPMGAFVRAFAEFGVPISIADARGPMGMAKWDHIRAVGQTPSVAAAWRARHGRDATHKLQRPRCSNYYWLSKLSEPKPLTLQIE